MVWANCVKFCPSAIAPQTSITLPCLNLFRWRGTVSLYEKGNITSFLETKGQINKAFTSVIYKCCSQTLKQWLQLKITLVKVLFNWAQTPAFRSIETSTNSHFKQPVCIFGWILLVAACSAVTTWKEKFPLCLSLPAQFLVRLPCRRFISRRLTVDNRW